VFNLLQEIILNLGCNFKNGDEDILNSILESVIAQAKIITNRTEVETTCHFEILDATKALYLLRGTEDTTKLNTPDRNMDFTDVMSKLRDSLVKNGKRLVF
jgi:hypothetical protein